MTLTELLKEFHLAYGCEINNPNFEEPEGDALVELRRRLIKEEFLETDEELSLGLSSEETLKELCDLVYVAVGTAVAFGWDFDGAFEEVHRSNMSKLGEDGRPVYREDFKVLKGANYTAPDLSTYV